MKILLSSKRITKNSKNQDTYYALVDNDSYETLKGFSWHISKRKNTNYAVRQEGNKVFYMHREIMADGDLIDHVNGDGLDNRRENLRYANKSQNALNSKKKQGSSPYKNVSWDKVKKKWRIVMSVNGKLKWFGYFTDVHEAGKVRASLAKEFYGQFAKN